MIYLTYILSMLAASAATTAVHDKNKLKLAVYSGIAVVSAFITASHLVG